MTEGDYLVGKGVNTSGKIEVEAVKGKTAALIDYVEGASVDVRCMDIAIQRYEEACLWAEKAITRPLRNQL